MTFRRTSSAITLSGTPATGLTSRRAEISKFNSTEQSIREPAQAPEILAKRSVIARRASTDAELSRTMEASAFRNFWQALLRIRRRR